ncbi:MAG: hypothetical protein ACK4NE_08600 [Albidovulum sp.]
MKIILSALMAVLLSAMPAAAYTAQNGLIVQAEGADTFFVPWRGKAGAADFWCAAGDYAVQALRLPVTTMVFRVSEPPRRSGDGVRFTLRADQAATSSGLALHWPGGPGLTAGSAQSLCENRKKRR